MPADKRKLNVLLDAELVHAADDILQYRESNDRNLWIADACWQRAHAISMEPVLAKAEPRKRKLRRGDGTPRIRMTVSMSPALVRLVQRQRARPTLNEYVSEYIENAMRLRLRVGLSDNAGFHHFVKRMMVENGKTLIQ